MQLKKATVSSESAWQPYGNSCLNSVAGASCLNSLTGASTGAIGSFCWLLCGGMACCSFISGLTYGSAPLSLFATVGAEFLRSRRRKYQTIIATIMRNAHPRPTPTPIPTFACGDRPDLWEDVFELESVRLK